MNEEPLSLKEYFPFLALLVASVFVITAVGSGSLSRSSAMLSQPDKAEPAEKKILRRVLPPPPEIGAHAYLVKIIGEEEPLAELRSWKALPPASLTKVLTSLIAYEELLFSEKISFSEEARAVEEKISKVTAGETFFRNDAVKFAIIESANDAGRALAETVGRKLGGFNFEDSLGLFVGKMNARALELGMQNSRFLDPTGLHQEGHFSTAEDLVKLAEYVWKKYPAIWEISRTLSTVVVSEEGSEYTITSTNELLKEFPAILGGKTGFTDEARGTLILLYPVRPDGVAVIVILGSEDRFGDGRKIIRWLEESF